MWFGQAKQHLLFSAGFYREGPEILREEEDLLSNSPTSLHGLETHLETHPPRNGCASSTVISASKIRRRLRGVCRTLDTL